MRVLKISPQMLPQEDTKNYLVFKTLKVIAFCLVKEIDHLENPHIFAGNWKLDCKYSWTDCPI